jgi:hypothetical protein
MVDIAQWLQSADIESKHSVMRRARCGKLTFATVSWSTSTSWTGQIGQENVEFLPEVRDLYPSVFYNPLPAGSEFEQAVLPTVWVGSRHGLSTGVAAEQPGQGLARWRQQPWVVGRSAVAGCRQAPVDGPGRRQAVSGPIDGWQVMPLRRGHSPLRCARPGIGVSREGRVA